MSNQNSKNATQNDPTRISYALTIACGATGIASYLTNSHSPAIQWTVLAHLLLGIVTTLSLTPYFYQHFRATVGFRRPALISTGLLSFLFFLCFVTSGWHLLFIGQMERFAWVLITHVYSAFAFFGIVISHIVLHVVTMPAKRKNHSEKKPSTLKSETIKSSGVALGLTILLLSTATITYQNNGIRYSAEPMVETYEYVYGPHPFRPSQTETPGSHFIDKRLIANSHRCITCHKDIGKQWYSSVHRQAASDPTYETNIKLLVKKKGISATRYCEGCHAPIALLSGELSPGGKHGGIEDTLANIEGVSCLSCHSINNVVHLKGVAAYQYVPHQPYLFANSNNPMLRRLHDHLLRVRPFQHRIDMGNKLLKDPTFCSTCHTQFMDKDMNNWGWVKMQDEYSAWLQSPFSRQHEETFASNEIMSCQNCHMPLVKSDDPSANGEGLVHSHHFPGGNTFLPVLANDQKQLSAVVKFMQSNKISVSIVKPERPDIPQNLQSIDESTRDFKVASHFYYLGETAKIQVVVTNQGIGHDFPGGTIDLGQAWVEFIVTDAENTVIHTEGQLDEDNYVDPDSYFYRSLPLDRHGNPVWKHDLFNMVGESFKRTIKSGESDIIDLVFEIPAWVKGPLNISATLKYRKLNEKYAKWALKEEYIPVPVIDIAWDSLQTDIKIRKKIESN